MRIALSIEQKRGRRRAYYRNNRARILALCAERYLKTKPARAAYYKKWSHENRDRVYRYLKKWNSKNKQKRSQYTGKVARRARINLTDAYVRRYLRQHYHIINPTPAQIEKRRWLLAAKRMIRVSQMSLTSTVLCKL